jgi:hypothetical protein
MNHSPLIRGFCRGISPQFDTNQQVSPMTPDFSTIASTYAVHPRTVRRWYRAGVEITNPQSVGKHLSEQRRPSIAAIRASLEILKSNL